MSRQIFNRPAIGGGAVAALTCMAANGLILRTSGTLGLLNDFYIYWSTAWVLNHGGNAYSRSAAASAHESAGLPGLMGAGYSYPPIFIEAVRPLGCLSPQVAAAIFTSISLLGLVAGVGLLLASIPGLSWPQSLFLGGLSGLFPPVAGGLWVGQANLLLLPALALAYRGIAPGLWIMVATAVKLYPGAGFLGFASRRDRMRQLGLAAVTGMVLLVGPDLLGAGVGGFGQRLADNLTPDTYFTNQSVTGFLSRMAMWPDWPLNSIPLMYVNATAIVVLTLAAGIVLWKFRFKSWEGSLALSVCLGTVIAPRNSLWNLTPLLLSLAYAVPNVRRRPWLTIGLVMGFVLTVLQPVVWAINISGDTIAASAYRDPLVALTSSLGLYGGCVIGSVCVCLLVSAPSARCSASAGRLSTGP